MRDDMIRLSIVCLLCCALAACGPERGPGGAASGPSDLAEADDQGALHGGHGGRGDRRRRGPHHGGDHDRGHDGRDDDDRDEEHDGCPPGKVTYTLGGTASGLAGTLVLHDPGAGDLTVTADGPFTFATGLPDGASYDVSVAAPPPGQTCAVTGGTGTMAGANVTSVAVSCATPPPPPPPPAAGGTLDASFGAGGKVTTDFSGAPPAAPLRAPTTITGLPSVR